VNTANIQYLNVIGDQRQLLESCLIVFIYSFTHSKSSENMSSADHADDLIDYEEEDEQTLQQEVTAQEVTALDNEDEDKKDKKGSYVGIHSTGFRDFLLKPELLRSIVDCGFEHPSEGKAL
jgi:hypothetical protein